MKILAQNRRARFDYDILETFEAGIILSGQEVKSVKQGHISLKSAYITTKEGEAYLINAHISPYKMAGELPEYNPKRTRKLLLHKKEINSLIGKKSQGLTIIPLRVYTKHGRVKLEIALARGKKKYDKREATKKREAERKIRRAMKEKYNKIN